MTGLDVAPDELHRYEAYRLRTRFTEQVFIRITYERSRRLTIAAGARRVEQAETDLPFALLDSLLYLSFG